MSVLSGIKKISTDCRLFWFYLC